jgi:hypothetical protein
MSPSTKPASHRPEITDGGTSGYFVREDWTLFRTLTTVCQKVGVPPGWLRRLVAKELADNALDVCGRCRIGELPGRGFFVEDDGPGIPGTPEDVASLFSIRRPLVSTKVIRLPTRGALGNGLRAVAGVVLSSGGRLEVVTGGHRLHLQPQDQGNTLVRCEPCKHKHGTRVEVWLGNSVPDEPNFLVWAQLAIDAAGEKPIYVGKTSPYFYDADSFYELLQAAGDKTVREVIEKFDGCSGRRAGEIARDFLGLAANRLSREQAELLLASARSSTNPVQAKRLQPLGRGPFGEHYARQSDIITIKPGRGGQGAQLPFTVEVWCRPAICSSDGLVILVNRTPVAAEIQVRRANEKTDIVIFGCNLSHSFRVGRKPVEITMNVQVPYVPITTDGKAPNLELFANDITDCVEKAARACQRRNSISKSSVTLKDAIIAELPEAIEKTSGGSRILFPQRNLYYAVRKLIQKHTSEVLTQSYFDKVVAEWEQHHGVIGGKYRDPRGYFVEPHTGRIIPLGTRQVEDYTIPLWLYDKILYVEKKGFHELFKLGQIAERFDLGIICAEGYATDAAKLLMARAQDAHRMTILSMTDADPYGYNIHRTLMTLTRTNQNISVIRMGLTLQEALDMGLEPETFERIEALPQGLDLNELEKEHFEGKQIEAKKWLCRRVELNALAADPEQFIAWTEAKLRENGCASKIVPPNTVILERAKDVAESQLKKETLDQITEVLGIEALANDIAGTLARKVIVEDLPDSLKQWAADTPPERWDHHLSHVLDGRVAGLRSELQRLVIRALTDPCAISATL